MTTIIPSNRIEVLYKESHEKVNWLRSKLFKFSLIFLFFLQIRHFNGKDFESFFDSINCAEESLYNQLLTIFLWTREIIEKFDFHLYCFANDSQCTLNNKFIFQNELLRLLDGSIHHHFIQ